jgi:branched-chain amino acid transport system permease protein
MSRVDLAQAGRLLRDGNGLIGIAVIVVVPIALGNVTLQSIAIFACVYGIIALGITVLHGYAGQFSLAYAVTAGVGAYISAYAAMDGIPTFIAIIFGAIGGGILGILVSGPALRIRGIQLAAVTLALMEAGSAVFSHISGYDGAGGVPLPGVFGYTFSSTQSQILFCGITFALIYLLLRVYLKSIAGKRLLLIKLSEESARSIGVNSVASKVTAFAVSSFAAGLGGALYPLLLQYIDPDSYDFSLLLLVFAVAIIGGMSRPEGAIWGAIFYAILTWIIGSSSIYSQAVFGALMLVAVIASPRVHEFQTIRARHPEDSGQVAQGRRVRARLAAGRIRATPARALPRPRPQRASGPSVLAAPEAGAAALRCQGISKHFGGVAALTDVDLAVPFGQIVALIGPNGAGKSTLVSILSGQLAADSGTVHIAEKLLDSKWEHRLARLGLSRTFQTPHLVGQLTVMENCRLAVGVGGERIAEQSVVEAATALGIAGYLDTEVQQLSYGVQKLADVCRSSSRGPRILLLDEPAAGLSGAEQELLVGWLRHLRESGTALLVVEHRMDFIRALADYVYVLDFGRMIADGEVRDVLSRPEVRDAYVGEAPEDAGTEAEMADDPAGPGWHA